MKPDTNSPGSITPEKKSESFGINKNEQIKSTELNSVSSHAIQPETLKNNQPNVGNMSKTAAGISESASSNVAENSFEAQIAQLPAEDTDIIEKVWVDKVDQVIKTTAEDPYFQEQGQHALSRKYLKTRFNLDLE